MLQLVRLHNLSDGLRSSLCLFLQIQQITHDDAKVKRQPLQKNSASGGTVQLPAKFEDTKYNPTSQGLSRCVSAFNLCFLSSKTAPFLNLYSILFLPWWPDMTFAM